MERRANYLLVGIFSVALVIAGVFFVIWANRHGSQNPRAHYVILFERPINGLSKGGEVRFLGVNVGQVENISLSTGSILRVRVQVAVDETVPLTTSTIASLKPNGLTGVYFIDLRPGEGGMSFPKADNPEDYPVIASEESALDKLVNGAPGLIEQVQNLLARAEKLLSDENIAALNGSIENINTFTNSLASNDKRLNATMENMETITHSLAKVSAALDKGTQEVDVAEMIRTFNAASVNLRSITERIDTILASRQGSIEQFTGQGLTDFRRLLGDVRRTTRNIDNLARQVGEDPTKLLFPPADKGVKIAP